MNKRPAGSPTRYLEDELDLPLSSALERMQYRILHQTRYRGVKTIKNPLDMWVYQDIIMETAPALIVEIGNLHGGTLLYLADLCETIGQGKVVGVDINHALIPPIVRTHPRIILIEGDACAVAEDVKKLAKWSREVMVIEDSSHTYENTLAVMRAYGPMVGVGHYMVVEDGICHHGLAEGPSPGPYEAIATFLAEEKRFVSHRTRESFLVTWNPMGYLLATGE